MVNRIPDKVTDRDAYLRYHRDKHAIEDMDKMRRTLAWLAEEELNVMRKISFADAAHYAAKSLQALKDGWQVSYISKAAK